MKAETAEAYPLFRDYDFGIHFSKPGQGVLLIPKGKLYVPKNYGFGLLALAPYIQEPFNDGENISVSDLIRELREEGEISLVSSAELDRAMGRSKSFLHETIDRFRKHMIVTLEKKAGTETSLDPQDILSLGENYETARVLRMDEYQDKTLVSHIPVEILSHLLSK